MSEKLTAAAARNLMPRNTSERYLDEALKLIKEAALQDKYSVVLPKDWVVVEDSFRVPVNNAVRTAMQNLNTLGYQVIYEWAHNDEYPVMKVSWLL